MSMSIASPASIKRLPSRELAERIEEFRSLKDGWMGEGSIAPVVGDLDRIVESFANHYSCDLPLPQLFPTSDGGVSAEWEVNDWSLSLAITFPEFSGYWHELQNETSADDDRTLNLSDADDWSWLTQRLRDLILGHS